MYDGPEGKPKREREREREKEKENGVIVERERGGMTEEEKERDRVAGGLCTEGKWSHRRVAAFYSIILRRCCLFVCVCVCV